MAGARAGNDESTRPASALRSPRLRPALEVASLLAAVLALALPAWAAAILLVGLGIALAVPPRLPGRRPAAAGMLLAATVLIGGQVAGAWSRPAPERRLAAIAAAYRALWDDLGAAATRAAAAVTAPAAGADARLAAFARLQALVASGRFADKTLLLVDPDGEAVAWAGDGLLHEPAPESLPRSGTAYRRSYTAVTALAVAPLDDARRPWRMVAGRSLTTERWPFEPAWRGLPAPRWSLGDPDPDSGAGTRAIRAADAPVLWLRWPPPAGADPWPGAARRLAAAFLALGLLAAALLRARPLLRPGSRPPGSAAIPAAMLVAAGTAAMRAAAVGPLPAATLVIASGLIAGVLIRRRRLPAWVTAALGAAAALAITGVAFWLQTTIGARDLGASFAAGGETLVLRLAFFLATGGLLALAARLGRGAPKPALAWSTVAASLAAAAAHDLPWLALPLLAVAGALAASWLRRAPLGRSVQRAGLAALVVALLAAACWETAYRMALRQELSARYLPGVAPPTTAEVTALELDLAGWAERFDIGVLQPPGPGPLDRGDLGYALWRISPLPERDSLSAVVAEGADGVRSSFAFDLPLDSELALVWDPDRLATPNAQAWLSSLVEGGAELELDGQPWGFLRYWMLPRPGFRFDVSEVDELQSALLRGRPHRRNADGLPAGVYYALYRDDGSVVSSPWRAAPPLSPVGAPAGAPAGLPAGSSSVLGGPARAETPVGPCWLFLRRGPEGVAVLYLPVRGAREASARGAVHALGNLLVVALLGLLAVAVAVPAAVVRGLIERLIRSYSKRLLLVYTLLLFLPLVALNLLLLQAFEARLRRDQVAQGEAALDAARTFLVNYIQGLEDGFSYDLLLDRELFAWLSSVVDRQVNLYWRSRLVASSQQALFTAGLLPNRIPGDVFARLSLLGHDLGVRARSAGDIDYLEVYAPVRLGGEITFVMSLPLLEQQEETARLLAAMRQQAVLISTALFLVLVALGGRLARGFTTPLTELIDGTRRIAGGASSLGLAPRELELAALAEAIDDMARRIADGRERLVREKQVVERMVENITSGVVSLDRDGRVLLHNRVAAEMLRSEVGEPLDRALAADPRLAPVRDFVAGAVAADAAGTDPAPRETTVSWTPAAGGEAREWSLTWVPVPGGVDPAALLVVDDDTEVLRGQRLAAWAEMARLIAHEIKNPLTPIRLSAEHMRQVHARDPERFDAVFERCVDNILHQVEELRAIASDFSTYSRIPRAELHPGDLVTTLAELAEGYRDAGQHGIGFTFTHPPEPVPARLDPTLLRRAVGNLLENAMRASRGDEKGRIELTLSRRDGGAEIRVADRGPGVPEEHLTRMFEPYFSTHDTGTGLGLPIAKRIVEEHEGTIEARNRPGGGLEVVIVMPLGDGELGEVRADG